VVEVKRAEKVKESNIVLKENKINLKENKKPITRKTS
jgi:hypothetical protein